MPEKLKKAPDAIPSFAGAVTSNLVVKDSTIALYREVAANMTGVKVVEIVGPNTVFISQKHKEKRITGPNQRLIGVTAMPQDLDLLHKRVGQLKKEGKSLN